MSSAPGKIRPRTNNCLELLNQIIETSNASHDQQAWAEDQRARLRLWARSLGVFATDRRLSIQHRLQDNSVVAKVIYQQLRSLRAELTTCLEQILSGAEDIHADNVSREEDSDTSVSSSSSDSRRRSSPRITDARSRVDDTIGRLTRLSASIRRDGALQREKRAIVFVPKDNGTSLVPEFSSYVDELCHRAFPVHESPAEGQFVVASHLRERVKRTMMQRWRRISYVNHHADKFGGVTLGDHSKEQTANRQLPTFLPSTNGGQNRSGPTDTVAKGHVLTYDARPATVVSDATVLRREFRVVPELLERPASQAATSVVTKTGAGDFPRPPKTRPGQKEFECQFCRQLLSVKESHTRRWRNHVTSDLAPYFCLFKKCGDSAINSSSVDEEGKDVPIEVFRTSEEWLAHMKQTHCRPTWNCSQCTAVDRGPASPSFHSAREIREHLSAEHGTNLSDEHSNLLLQTTSGWEPLIFEQCSFCSFQPDLPAHNGDFKEESFQSEIIDHMQKSHMLTFALMSLPWHIAGDVDEGRSNTAVHTGSTGESSNQGKNEILNDPHLLDNRANPDDIALQFGRGNSANFLELRNKFAAITNTTINKRIEEWLSNAPVPKLVKPREEIQKDKTDVLVSANEEHDAYWRAQMEEDRGLTEYWSDLNKEIYQWLEPHDPLMDHDHARLSCQSGTGSWMLNREDYRIWKSRRQQCLWLHGPLGCGKTILCSTIIADLLEGNQKSSENVFFFYFDRTDPRRSHYFDFVCSLLWHFTQQTLICREHLHLILERSKARGESRLNPADGLEALDEMLRIAEEPIRVVLDAVDQCEQIDALSLYVERLCSHGSPFLLISRNTMRIGDIVPRGHAIIGIECEKRFVEGDIKVVVETTFAEDKTISPPGLNVDESSALQSALVKRADGMFLWAKCQLLAISECYTMANLEDQLSTAPQALELEYTRILKAAAPADVEILCCILGFLFFLEPLTLEEALDMLKWNSTPDQPRDLALKGLLRQFSDVLCERHEMVNKEVRTTIELYHWTVKTVFNSRKFLVVSEGSELPPLNAEHTLILCLDRLIMAARNNESVEVIQRESPFAQYAARNCMLLASEVEKRVPSAREKILDLFISVNTYSLWMSLADPDIDIPAQYEDRLPLERDGQRPQLYCASLHGLYYTVEVLLERGSMINAKGGWYGTALQAAAARGHLEVVQLLLRKGADVNSKGGLYGTALQAAAGGISSHPRRQLEIVTELLNSGAEIRSYDGIFGDSGVYGDALRAACAEGHLDIVQFLLESGADANDYRSLGYFGTALQSACADGHFGIAQILLEHGADVNVSRGLYNTALQAACAGGHEEVVQLLLEHGANTSIIGGCGGTALLAACAENHINVVRSLLEHEANIDIRKPGGHGALHLCAANGDQELMRVLLEWGADIEIVDDATGRTPLHYAAENGHESVLRLLLEKGALINSRDQSKGRTPLHYAAREGFLEILSVLLENGAKVNETSDVDRRSALHYAAEKGHFDAALQLVSRGADVSALDAQELTAAALASETGQYAAAWVLGGLDDGSQRAPTADAEDRPSTSSRADSFNPRQNSIGQYLCAFPGCSERGQSSRSKLLIHLQKHVSEGGSYVCDFCPRRFWSSETLQRHRNLHRSFSKRYDRKFF